jgi:hypothetical protein
MKLFFQILFLLFTWFTNQLQARQLFIKITLPSNEITFLKVESVKEENNTNINNLHSTSAYPQENALKSAIANANFSSADLDIINVGLGKTNAKSTLLADPSLLGIFVATNGNITTANELALYNKLANKFYYNNKDGLEAYKECFKTSTYKSYQTAFYNLFTAQGADYQTLSILYKAQLDNAKAHLVIINQSDKTNIIDFYEAGHTIHRFITQGTPQTQLAGPANAFKLVKAGSIYAFALANSQSTSIAAKLNYSSFNLNTEGDKKGKSNSIVKAYYHYLLGETDFANKLDPGLTFNLNNAGSLSKVALGSEDLSQFAVNFRKTLATPNHRGNVAVFEYVDNNGNLVKKAFTTEVNNSFHSEEIAIDFFSSQNIPKQNIKRIYSELEPCELTGHTCKVKLDANFPSAQKSYSYDYPGGVDNSIRQASVNQRSSDLENLLK